MKHHENTTSLLVSFHRKTEYINDKNKINYCHIPRKEYKGRLNFLMSVKIIFRKFMYPVIKKRWDAYMKNWNGNRFYLLVIIRFIRSEDKVDLSCERSQAVVYLCKYFFVLLMLTIKYDLVKVGLMKLKARIPWNVVELILKKWSDE